MCYMLRGQTQAAFVVDAGIVRAMGLEVLAVPGILVHLRHFHPNLAIFTPLSTT
jgi:hypothetical protein